VIVLLEGHTKQEECKYRNFIYFISEEQLASYLPFFFSFFGILVFTY